MVDADTFAGFRPQATVRGLFGDPQARLLPLIRRSKTLCGTCGAVHSGWYDRKTRRVRDLSGGDPRLYLDLAVRRGRCRRCGKVKRERLDLLSTNPLSTKRFAHYGGQRCRSSTIEDGARELKLDWHPVTELETQHMRAQLERAGTPAPKVIGIAEVSIRKRHVYRSGVSDLLRGRPIGVGGEDRSEQSLRQCDTGLGEKQAQGIRLAVRDMWKPFRKATEKAAAQAASLFDQFHILRHLGEALAQVRKSEYARLTGQDRRFSKGQKYTLLSRREHLTLEGRQALKRLLAANQRLHTAYLLTEAFGQLWSDERAGWARRFFENWRNSLKGQRLKPYEKVAQMIERHWDGSAA